VVGPSIKAWSNKQDISGCSSVREVPFGTRTYTAVINNVDNDGELAAVLAVVDEDKTTDLNLTLE